ncbi:hypothetical protein ACFT0G_20965 [Streptomyces sp. NPDC057020]|uniref:hypothetical protein n=1 Tax=unclassified Streptomyces TaxID=2593676 RepID=UPI0036304DE3
MAADDAGSIESGPAALGSGTPKLSAQAVTRDLRLLLRAREQLQVPLIIGSCGTSGRDVGVDCCTRNRLSPTSGNAEAWRTPGCHGVRQSGRV